MDQPVGCAGGPGQEGGQLVGAAAGQNPVVRLGGGRLGEVWVGVGGLGDVRPGQLQVEAELQVQAGRLGDVHVEARWCGKVRVEAGRHRKRRVEAGGGAVEGVWLGEVRVGALLRAGRGTTRRFRACCPPGVAAGVNTPHGRPPHPP
jgi:hypothetical protein